MAYFRTLKSGERRLIYTAKDKAKQTERRNLYYRGLVPHLSVINYAPLLTSKEWKESDYTFFWRFHNYDKETMKNAIKAQRYQVERRQRIVLASLYRERKNRHTWEREITLNGVTRLAEATCSYLAYERGKLAYEHMLLRNMKAAYRKFTN